MKKYILLILFTFAFISMAHAGDDPMKSLFTFQQKMASNGSTAAMMKLGEMYEQGVGTKKNLDMALIMYRRAKNGGYPGADVAITRVLQTRQAAADSAKRKKLHNAEMKQREQEQKRAEAEHRAQLERQQRERVAAERAAKAKAEKQAAARKRAEMRAEQARRQVEQARIKAQMEARAKAIATAKEKARQQALAREKAQAQNVKPKAKVKDPDDKKPESFKSDPCKGPAAKVMSICK